MVVIKPHEIKILCMQTHIPSQEKPEALCSGKICIRVDIYSLYPFVLVTQCTQKVYRFSALYHLIRLSSTFGGFQESCRKKCKQFIEEEDGPSYSLRKKYSWFYVRKPFDDAVSHYQRLWKSYFQFKSSYIFMQSLIYFFLMSLLCLSTSGSTSWHCELLGWTLFLHLCFGFSLEVLRSHFKLIHKIIYIFMYKPMLSSHIK